ncbi:Hpt domain-containing protein [Bradyrhizobium betae]|uniref:Hpt domain-containing protein n=1 Tax=Bradyrhizobium betae TaxID=244734 RepID=UPI003D677552
MMSEGETYPLEQFRKTYFEECAELLDVLQANLELLAAGAGGEETLHAIFRAVHSIKGGPGRSVFHLSSRFRTCSRACSTPCGSRRWMRRRT